MLERFRQLFTRLLSPVANGLLRMGVSPDTVTAVGTAGVCTGALVFFPRGQLFLGAVVITAFVFSDLVDGAMARAAGCTSSWGAFWDSTLDRFGDAAIFAGLVVYFARRDDLLSTSLALFCLVMGSITSYARARAESLGMSAKVGLVERADRLVAILLATGLSDLFGVPVLLTTTLWLLAAASTVTVVQRLVAVRRQSLPRSTAV